MTHRGMGGGLAAPALRKMLRAIEDDFAEMKRGRDQILNGLALEKKEHEETRLALAMLLDGSTRWLATPQNGSDQEATAAMDAWEAAIAAAKKRLGRAL